MEIIFLLILGFIAGILAGLLGIGGGAVIVPALVWIFHYGQSVPSVHLMHIAIGTSLATIVATSIASIWAHHRHGAVQWSIVWQLAPGVALGAFLGAWIAHYLSSDFLRIIFGIFLLLLSIEMIWGKKPAAHRQLPNRYLTGMIAVFIGILSALVGIGGGSLTVPFLTFCNVTLRHAIATSAACGFPIALAGAMGFIVTGWSVSHLPNYSLGYVYLPAFILVAAISVFTAPLGAKLTHTLPTTLLKKLFGIFLAIIALKMLWG
ncbi:sulfite exporter TauE/SafE family protein [Thioflexithrix psekupsensis]|uniref:Probable membrane transporter protein n=1 Tax=Thioflexithrix psekupsensis TaxID=1570016 RepID=A0A251X533_9GAMM|nr:sulfite exporter TauE/SafE family protein [Thioflexithrix psekupsensis]OUD12604.1 hypothetical protein TPSD3_16110 [Thioflexithrix psekupsensis]